MRAQYRRQILILLILLIGFFVGSALPQLLYMGTGTYAGFFSLYSFQKYQETAVNSWNIFPYILNARLQPLLFLWMSSFTTAGVFFHVLYAGWLAVAAGMLLALFTLREGYEGLLFFGCCLFPQWILYIAMWKREARFLIEQQKRRFQGIGMAIGRLHQSDMLELAKIMAYAVLGSAMEAFLGTWTLKIFLQILT